MLSPGRIFYHKKAPKSKKKQVEEFNSKLKKQTINKMISLLDDNGSLSSEESNINKINVTDFLSPRL